MKVLLVEDNSDDAEFLRLPNRQYLREQLERATAGALNARQKVALLLLDLDRFKVVNDSLGHQVGDELLRAVVQRLRDNLREGRRIARLGGDELALLIEDFETTAELEAMATEIVRRFEARFVVGERQLSVTASIGIAAYPIDNTALLNNADIAMYRAKEQMVMWRRSIDCSKPRGARCIPAT
jgi:diguanylate cyclase